MNVKRFLGICLFTYLICAAMAVGFQKDTPAKPYVKVPATITLAELSPQQMQDRAVELTTTTSTSTSTSTTTTQPTTTVVAVPADTHCQEWFPIAIEVGWPNDPAILEKLGRLLYKETRCMNVTPLSSDPKLRDSFNGHDYGIAQINDIHTKYVEQLFNMPFAEAMSDPTLNLRFAYLLYSDLAETGACGWRPWSLC
jgi:hypothetical protein